MQNNTINSNGKYNSPASTKNHSVVLQLDQVTMQFGGLKAVDGVSLSVPKDCLYGLIGPNGAGKTTAFNVITGVYRPTQGRIFLNGKDLTNLKPFEISRLGMTRTFQNIRLFKNLSVLENLLIAMDQHNNYDIREPLFFSKNFLNQERKSNDFAMDLLKVFHLENKAKELSSSLPYGEQRKLEIARALATKPQLILLDEPAAGMNHAETHALMKTLEQVRKQFQITIVLIEHDMKLVMGICELITVLDHGEKIAEGTPSEIRGSQKVIEAYLGREAEA